MSVNVTPGGERTEEIDVTHLVLSQVVRQVGNHDLSLRGNSILGRTALLLGTESARLALLLGSLSASSLVFVGGLSQRSLSASSISAFLAFLGLFEILSTFRTVTEQNG